VRLTCSITPSLNMANRGGKLTLVKKPCMHHNTCSCIIRLGFDKHDKTLANRWQTARLHSRQQTTQGQNPTTCCLPRR
jgi:hypothetical protein